MRNYVAAQRGRAFSVGGANEIDIVMGAKARRPISLAMPKPPGRIRRRRHPPKSLPTGIAADIEQAVEEALNYKQRIVYRGRVLSEPQVPVANLAKQLRIADVSQISRILKQAQAKVTMWLNRGKTPEGA
jgi:hypothetical protein